METLLVIGGAGYIGSHTSYLLAQYGYQVIILDSFVHNQPFEHSWATVIRGDYGDSHLLQRIFSSHTITAVMHFAGFTSVGESVHTPAPYYENNVAKTMVLLRVMHEYAVDTLVFSSSAAVYGIPDITPITEEHATQPVNAYGNTKLVIEYMLHDYAQAYGLRFVALRYFNAAGAQPEHGLCEYHVPETHIIPLAIEAALSTGNFNIFGDDYPTPDGTCVRDYVHVTDIAQAHVCALHYLNQGGMSGCFNLGTGSGYSVREILMTIAQVCGVSIKYIVKPRRAGDPAILVADASKACNMLHWDHRYSQLPVIIESAYRSIYIGPRRVPQQSITV